MHPVRRKGVEDNPDALGDGFIAAGHAEDERTILGHFGACNRRVEDVDAHRSGALGNLLRGLRLDRAVDEQGRAPLHYGQQRIDAFQYLRIVPHANADSVGIDADIRDGCGERGAALELRQCLGKQVVHSKFERQFGQFPRLIATHAAKADEANFPDIIRHEISLAFSKFASELITVNVLRKSPTGSA